MLSSIFRNEEVNQLHALRARTTNCKMNLKNIYIQDKLLCDLCFTENRDQRDQLLHFETETGIFRVSISRPGPRLEFYKL